MIAHTANARLAGGSITNMEYELCVDCNQPTGRAGKAEDSLYVGDSGPFCEDCYEIWRKEPDDE